MRTTVVRPYTEADIPQLIELQHQCFPPPYPPEQCWNREQLESHIQYFPAGAVCVEVDGCIIASGTTLLARLDLAHRDHTWSEVTAADLRG